MKDLNIIIGTNIRELRKVNKMTQNDLAIKLNYSNKAVSRWESGEIVPDVETINKICDIFNIPIALIFEQQIDKNRLQKQTKRNVSNKVIISLLAIMAVWCLAIVGFVYSNIVFSKSVWQLFLWAVPVSCVVGIIFNAIWGKKWLTISLISLLLWSILACIYVAFLKYNIWLIFIVGLPIQICIALSASLNRKSKKNKDKQKNEDEIEKQNTSEN